MEFLVWIWFNVLCRSFDPKKGSLHLTSDTRTFSDDSSVFSVREDVFTASQSARATRK